VRKRLEEVGEMGDGRVERWESGEVGEWRGGRGERWERGEVGEGRGGRGERWESGAPLLAKAACACVYACVYQGISMRLSATRLFMRLSGHLAQLF
jgi:hypothetical protein